MMQKQISQNADMNGSKIQIIHQLTLFLDHFKQEKISVNIQYYKVYIYTLKICVYMHARV